MAKGRERASAVARAGPRAAAVLRAGGRSCVVDDGSDRVLNRKGGTRNGRVLRRTRGCRAIHVRVVRQRWQAAGTFCKDLQQRQRKVDCELRRETEST